MTDCPALTRLTPETIAITKDLVTELRVSTYDRTPGTQVTVSCQFDLELVGPSTVTCGNNGQWSATPTCQIPTMLVSVASTATTSSDDSGLDESTVLLIVLIVVVVFVIAVIIIICVALYYGRLKRRREKSKTEGSFYGDYGEGSTPYSIELSERNDSNNVAMYNVYNDYNGQSKVAEGPRRPDPVRNHNEYYRQQTSDRRHDHHDDIKKHRYHRSYDDLYDDTNFRFRDLHMDEPYENRLPRPRDDTHHHHYHHERLYEKNPKGSRSPQPRSKRYTSRCPNCSHISELKHAKSADDIMTDREDLSDRDLQNDRPYFRRDHFLWRSMDANWSNSIPRPYYE